jgi:hypothetical protein
MNSIRELHKKAMDLADLALAAKYQSDLESFEKLSTEAYNYELQAAESVRNDLSAEPTRSVLYRSAASLAIDCKRFPEAVRLIEIALGGNPPHDIAEELRDLREVAGFYRHLEVRGVSLGADEVQFSIDGPILVMA